MDKKTSVLFLTTNDIREPIRGCDRRSAQLCSNLPSEWHIDTISYNKSKSNKPIDEKEIKSETDENHAVFQYPSLSLFAPFNARVFYQIYMANSNYDVVIASGIGSVLYGIIASFLYNTIFIFDSHNVEHKLSVDIGNYPRFLFAITFGKLALNRADLVVLTSAEDANQFDSAVRKKSVIVANGFDSNEFYRTEQEAQDRILFFGNMGYEPNQEAVEVITNTIAPSLKGSRPETDIHIAGPNCDNVANIVADNDNIKLVGLVDDISAYIRESKVVIVPLKTGSGTRLKIIESLACGTPVISTPKGAEGWPDDWENLTCVPLERFPNAIDSYLLDGEFDHSKYDDILTYSWNEQVSNIITRIEQELK